MYRLVADGEGGFPGTDGQDGRGVDGSPDGDNDDNNTDVKGEGNERIDPPDPQCSRGICTCLSGWRLQSGQCVGKCIGVWVSV